MQNNPMYQMMQFLNGGGNPQQLIQQALQANPQMRQAFQQLQNMQKSNNLSDKDFALQFLKQQGFDPQQVMQLANRMGIQ